MQIICPIFITRVLNAHCAKFGRLLKFFASKRTDHVSNSRMLYSFEMPEILPLNSYRGQTFLLAFSKQQLTSNFIRWLYHKFLDRFLFAFSLQRAIKIMTFFLGNCCRRGYGMGINGSFGKGIFLYESN